MIDSPSPSERVAYMVATLRNFVVAIPDLRKRVLLTLILLGVYRIGTHIPMPGVNFAVLREIVGQFEGFGAAETLTGQSLSRLTIFALGITPYITASIIVQLLATIWPSFRRISQEGDLGRQKLTQYTRYLTLVLALIQAIGYALWLERALEGPTALPLVVEPGWGFRLMFVLTLTTGTMFAMWLGEQINERGIGNGMALIIISGIVVRLPTAALTTLEQIRLGAVETSVVIALMIGMAIVTGVVVLMVCAHRGVNIQSARQRTQIPLKLNTSGVIPVIFATITLSFLATAAGLVGDRDEVYGGPYVVPLYYVLFMGLVIFFGYFYTAIVFDSNDVAENVAKYGGSIPGIKPEKRTREYIDTILTRTTLIWSSCLAVVVILPRLLILGFRPEAVPAIADWLVLDLPRGVPFYSGGGTGLVILVGVLIDMVGPIESQLIVRSWQRVSVTRSGGDATLVEDERARSIEVDYETFVPVFTPRGPAMASCVEWLLRSEGIRFFITNERVQDLFGVGRVGTGFCALTGASVVCVEPTRAEEAADLLARIDDEHFVGTVVHYFAKPQVGVVHLGADLEVGETLHFCGCGANFQQVVTSMQRDHRPVEIASAATEVAVKVDQRVRAGTQIYRVTGSPRRS